MHGLRQRLDFAGLALFALAVQFYAAFGHVHLAAAKPHPFAQACFNASAAKAGLPCIPRHHADHDCAVCLAASAKASPPSAIHAIAPPELSSAAVYTPRAALVARRAPPLAFQARGPPAAC